MAKTIEDLRQSRENREKVIEHLGCVPESILLHDKSHRSIDIIVQETRSYENLSDNGGHSGALGQAFSVSGKTCRGEGAGLSRFPQNIGTILLKLYTQPGDTVVDPFAGHNSRMEFCWRNNRNYIGNDLSKEFMVANRKIRDMLLEEASTDLFSGQFKASITLTEGDSRNLTFEDGIGDFTITSPPYWSIEYYGAEPEQLGGDNTYEQFLEGLGQVIKQNYRCLKPGAFCIYCINDFRMKGKFYSFHEDTADLLRAAGFYQWDIAITDLGSSFGSAFAQQVVDRKILPKRHEYCLIYRKPA